jgi:hypothetical protein
MEYEGNSLFEEGEEIRQSICVLEVFLMLLNKPTLYDMGLCCILGTDVTKNCNQFQLLRVTQRLPNVNRTDNR